MSSLRLAVCLAALSTLAQAFSAQTPQDAQALEARGDWAGAEAAWRSLTTKHPEDYRFWTSLGIALAHESKFSDAIQAYRKALALNPQAPQTQFNLGLAYFKSGELDKAIGPLENAARAFPGSQQVEVVLGMCLYGMGRYRDAVPPLEAAQSKGANNKELAFVLAQAYLWSGAYDKAKLAFESLLESDPDSAQVHMLLGEAQDAMGHTEEAITEFQKATAKGQIPDAHFGLGYLLWKTHRFEEASSEFRNELRIDPKSYKALAYLGDAEYKLGQIASAKRDLLKSIALRDALWISQFDVGKIEEDEKNYSAATSHLKRAVELEPDRPEPHYHLARIYAATGNTSQARAEFATVAHLHQKKSDDLIVKISGDRSQSH